MPEKIIEIKQNENKSRLAYLARTLYVLMQTTEAGKETVIYDDMEQSGLCLADDILTELNIDPSDIDLERRQNK